MNELYSRYKAPSQPQSQATKGSSISLCFFCPKYVTSPAHLKGREGFDSSKAVTQVPGGSFQHIQMYSEQCFLEPIAWSLEQDARHDQQGVYVPSCFLSHPQSPICTTYNLFSYTCTTNHSMHPHRHPHRESLPNTGLHTCPQAVGTKGTSPKEAASSFPPGLCFSVAFYLLLPNTFPFISFFWAPFTQDQGKNRG